jgi:hypothetical protein
MQKNFQMHYDLYSNQGYNIVLRSSGFQYRNLPSVPSPLSLSTKEVVESGSQRSTINYTRTSIIYIHMPLIIESFTTENLYAHRLRKMLPEICVHFTLMALILQSL